MLLNQTKTPMRVKEPINPAVTYANDALVIRIPTKTPSETHLNIIKGITSAARAVLNDPDKTMEDCVYVIELMRLLEEMTPTPKQLQLAYAV